MPHHAKLATCLLATDANGGQVLLAAERGPSACSAPQRQDCVRPLGADPAQAEQLPAVPRIEHGQTLAL